MFTYKDGEVKHSFTVEQILQAAEQSKLPNNNYSYIGYRHDRNGDTIYPHIPISACVIGEAYLNLGMAENGTDAYALSRALVDVKPDGGEVALNGTVYTNLSGFINDLNDSPKYRGKRRIPRLVRKYFSKSLQQVVEF